MNKEQFTIKSTREIDKCGLIKEIMSNVVLSNGEIAETFTELNEIINVHENQVKYRSNLEYHYHFTEYGLFILDDWDTEDLKDCEKFYEVVSTSSPVFKINELEPIREEKLYKAVTYEFKRTQYATRTICIPMDAEMSDYEDMVREELYDDDFECNEYDEPDFNGWFIEQEELTEEYCEKNYTSPYTEEDI